MEAVQEKVTVEVVMFKAVRSVGVDGGVVSGIRFIVKICALLVPPLGAILNTVTLLVPAAVISEDDTVACKDEEDMKVVTRGELFQFTFEFGTKPVPFTTKVNSELPAVAEAGEIEIIVGAGLGTDPITPGSAKYSDI